jgi:hypothetical protein
MFGQRHDPRTVHLRRLRSSRARAGGWTVWAGTAVGAAAVAVPYAGLGALDIVWAGLPGPPPPTLAARISPLVMPVLRTVGNRPLRVTARRGSAAAPAVQRLNRAAKALPGLLDRLGPHAADTAREAAGAHAALRDLVVRVGAVEKALPVAPPGSREPLGEARARLVEQLAVGVEAYERLTAAAAECVAATTTGSDRLGATRLTEAAERLTALAQGFTEMRQRNQNFRLSG